MLDIKVNSFTLGIIVYVFAGLFALVYLILRN